MPKSFTDRAASYLEKEVNKFVNGLRTPVNSNPTFQQPNNGNPPLNNTDPFSFLNANFPSTSAANAFPYPGNPYASFPNTNVYSPQEYQKPQTFQQPRTHQPSPTAAPAHPPSSALYTPSSHSNDAPVNSIFPSGLLDQLATRPSSAVVKFGNAAIQEARKGLSRIVNIRDYNDVLLLEKQLKTVDVAAVEKNYLRIEDDIPCFALSYEHRQEIGRFKFSDEQWKGLVGLFKAMNDQGIHKVRLWLDQCLWLRDASQGAWAHTGILPYILWPVICLGTRKFGCDRSRESFERMWPFVEEVAGLWSMGVIFVWNMRDRLIEKGVRTDISFSLREMLPPELSMSIVLLNIYHGAVDLLKTGWKEDVDELKEMARWNVNSSAENLCLGSDWKQRVMETGSLQANAVVANLKLPMRSTYLGGINVYLDGSRAVKLANWSGGTSEFMSGNAGALGTTNYDATMMEILLQKVNVITDRGEFQMLCIGDLQNAVWLLVAMKGRSANFSRGKVAWTKVMIGEGSCGLQEAVHSGNVMVVGNILSEQLESPVHVHQVTPVSAPIEWI